MNKFQKLAQLNRDIELLEKAGKIKSADILHQKFIKEAQMNYPRTHQDRAPDLNPGFNTNIEIRNFILDYANDIKNLGNKAPIPKTLLNSKEEDFINKVKQGQIDPNLFDYNTVHDYAFKIDNKTETNNASNNTFGGLVPQVGTRKPQMGKMDLAVTPVSNIGPNPERNNDVQTSPQGAQNSGDGLTVNKGNIIYPEDTANENAEVLFAEKMKKRIQYYEGKIKEYHEQTDLKYKEKMLLYLTTYMDKNYDQGELDPNSYSRLMNALGEKSGIS